MRIAFGLIRADAGELMIRGKRVQLASPADAIAAGIGMVHQQFSLVAAMTVAENVALGGKGRLDIDAVSRTIAELGERTGLTLDPRARVADLGSADRQKLEIMRTLAHDAHTIILDEPTAVLTPTDVTELFTQLRAFAASGGTVILITHKLRDALAYADDVTVLRHGRTVLTGRMSEASAHSLTTATIGSTSQTSDGSSTTVDTVDRPAHPAVATISQVVIDLHDPGAQPVSLQIERGEIVGIAALEGKAAGLLRMLAGRLVPDTGMVSIPEHVGFVPENRQEEAIIPDFTLTENLALKDAGVRSGKFDWYDFHTRATTVIAEFDVKVDSSESTARLLSGGNQQRFVLGRELSENPPLLVLENPTQGLDVKAAAAIHFRVREAATRGTAVAFYSSDLDELAELSSRVVVMRRSGMVVCAPDREVIGRLLLETELSAVHG